MQQLDASYFRFLIISVCALDIQHYETKKVIAYMTLGIDVSRLFTEMMMAIETRDLVVKKMVYLYLCTYARQQPDLAIMCINTLQRDW